MALESGSKKSFAEKLALILGLAVFLAGSAIPDPSRAARPNIIVIQTDDQSLGSLRSTYKSENGRDLKVMPQTLREIFRGGTEFTHTYVASPLCSPSRAALLTGQYPHNNGLLANEGLAGGWTGWQALPIQTRNVPVSLRSAGYRTSHFGKFTNSYYDTDSGRPESEIPPGWNRWFSLSFLSGTAAYYGYYVNDNGTVRGPIGSRNYELKGSGTDNRRRCGVRTLTNLRLGSSCHYLTDVLTRNVVREIQLNARKREKPFYIHLDYLAPHGDASAPIGPQPASRHVYSARRTPLRRTPSFNEPDMSDKPPQFRDRTERFDPATIRGIRNAWQRTIESLRSVDDGVGAIFKTLRKTGLNRNTYVFFTSDNGMFFGEHRFKTGKSQPYEAVSRVPLAVTGPGVPKGKRTTRLASTMDIPRTALALAGVTPSYPMDGLSLKKAWGPPSGPLPERGLLISLSGATPEGEPPTPASRKFTAIRVGPFKYVRYQDGSEELYDLSSDPWELENQSESSGWEPVLTYMRDQSGLLESCTGEECRQGLPRPPAPPGR